MNVRPAWRRAGLVLCTAAMVLASAVSAASAAGPENALDQRAWEMVSPANMNGGEVEAPGGADAGVLQAAAAGGALAFGSATSFGGGQGAAPVSQYSASRGQADWATVNLTPPLLSGTYEGGAYQLLSPQLDRAILGSGWRCREGGESCAAENPPLAPGAPTGYRNLYLRETGKYQSLITTANAPALSLSPEAFGLELEGAAADLGHAVLSSCAALTADAVEVPDGAGCDPQSTNLYRWSAGGSLEAVNLLPGEDETAPGASLAAPAGAISSDGSRVYWTGADGNLYLREDGTQTVQVDGDVGGGGSFQAATTDGSLAYFAKAGHLYRFAAAGALTTDLTPAGEVQGVLGASADGSYVYYLATSGLYLWQASTTTKVAAAADPSNFPPATGTAHLTPDGTRLAFISSASLTGYNNNGKAEVFIYEAPDKRLLCVSCNPTARPPVGPSAIAASIAAGDGPAAHKPRSLSADGTRIFFDSEDALVVQDSDKAPDVYEWQARNTGGCQKASGCLGLISGGRSGEASFLDASADGTDVFFLTNASLLPQDIGGFDAYDARSGGGFPEPEPQIPCNGDACQGPAPAPEVSIPGTAILVGPANPPALFKKPHHKKPHHKKAHKKKHHKKAKRHQGKRAHKHGGRR